MKNLFCYLSILALIFMTGCGLMDSLDTTNQNTTEMNQDMGLMVEGVGDMGLRTEKISTSMDDVNSNMGQMSDAVNQMTKNMEQMQKTMREMKETMAEMSEKMVEMRGDVVKLGADGRQGIALGIRTQAWNRLVDSQDINAKLAAASAYHMSFEFQTWKGTGIDTEKRREDLFFDALAEYFRTVYIYADRNNWSLNVMSKSNDMNVLFALAGTLEKVNTNQQIFLPKGQAPISFLNLLKRSVRSIKSSGLGDQIPQYLEEAAEFKQLIVYLLNLRQNILSGLVVSKLARLDKANNRMSELLKQGRLAFEWQPDIEEYAISPGLLLRMIRYINESNSMRTFLCSESEKFQNNYTDLVQVKTFGLLKRSIAKMKVDSQFETAVREAQSDSELAARFIRSVHEFRLSILKPCSI